GIVDGDFEVQGDHEFAVATWLLTTRSSEATTKGDPSQSAATPVEQYRTSHVFGVSDDFDASYVDVIQPMDAAVEVDGAPAGGAPSPVGGAAFGVARIQLHQGEGRAHVVSSDKPVGIQVVGYGPSTSYEYPGGSGLKPITPSPPQ